MICQSHCLLQCVLLDVTLAAGLNFARKMESAGFFRIKTIKREANGSRELSMLIVMVVGRSSLF